MAIHSMGEILVGALGLVVFACWLFYADIFNFHPVQPGSTPAHVSDSAYRISPWKSGDPPDSSVGDGYFETVDEIITRLERDVVLTATLKGESTYESAIFRIEGLPERRFKLGHQLMDGFIIVEIGPNSVRLKNQIGPEQFRIFL